MKITFSILISLILFTANAQNTLDRSFLISSSNYLKDSCDFLLECDCCWSDLILSRNGSFIKVHPCDNSYVEYGKYKYANDSLTLIFSNQVLNQKVNAQYAINFEMETPKYQRDEIDPWLYSIDSFYKKAPEVYLVSSCSSDMKITEAEEGCYIGLESYEAIKSTIDPLIKTAECYYYLEPDFFKKYDGVNQMNEKAFANDWMDRLNCKLQIEGCGGFLSKECSSNIGYASFHWYNSVSPADSTFRIFSFKGEITGAYVSGIHHNLLEVKNKWSTIDHFQSVDKIIQYSDNLYAVRSTSYHGGTTRCNFSIVELDGDSLVSVKITTNVNTASKMFSYYFGRKANGLSIGIRPKITFEVNNDTLKVDYEYYFDERYSRSLENRIPNEIYLKWTNQDDDKELYGLKFIGELTYHKRTLVGFKEKLELDKNH